MFNQMNSKGERLSDCPVGGHIAYKVSPSETILLRRKSVSEWVNGANPNHVIRTNDIENSTSWWLVDE